MPAQSPLARHRLAWWLVMMSCLLLVATSAGAQESPASGGDEPAASALPPDETFLQWMVRASGPIGLVLLLMSFYLVAVVAWMAFEYRRSKALPEALLRGLSDDLAAKRFPQAYERIAADKSFLGRVLAAGVRKLSSGVPAAQRAMQVMNDDITMEMEHRTTYLSTVGTLGPLIGLLGTVYGMIISFRVMSLEGTPQASQLAAGISTALFATLEGIAIAIPAIACYAFFRNRIARLSVDVEQTADGLLDQFVPGVRPPHPVAQPQAGPFRTALSPPPVAKPDEEG